MASQAISRGFESRYPLYKRVELGGFSMPRVSLNELVEDPAYIQVYTDDNERTGSTCRIVKRSVLHAEVKRGCSLYQEGVCSDCFTSAREIPYSCKTAWSLTKSKGRKLY